MPPEIYVSTDVETDGPIPGPHSMLSLASAAFLADGTRLASFEVNLETLPEAQGHPETMAWWAGQPEAWEACRRAPEPPSVAMPAYLAWVEALPGRPVFAAYPVGFDFAFVSWYLHRFAGRNPFSHSALDIKTLAMALLRRPYRAVSKRVMPRRWLGSSPHTHVALDDAIEQGEMLCRMLGDLDAERAAPPAPAGLERAIAIASTAHAGAVDKGGQPYILHPLRVMAAVDGTEAKIAAVLHDLVEDTDWTLEALEKEGFSATVVGAVGALTRREGEDYLDFVRRAGNDPIARAVKLADLADNMDLSRLREPTEADRVRLERYRAAMALLGAG